MNISVGCKMKVQRIWKCECEGHGVLWATNESAKVVCGQCHKEGPVVRASSSHNVDHWGKAVDAWNEEEWERCRCIVKDVFGDWGEVSSGQSNV